jgi:hypothetical protein
MWPSLTPPRRGIGHTYLVRVPHDLVSIRRIHRRDENSICGDPLELKRNTQAAQLTDHVVFANICCPGRRQSVVPCATWLFHSPELCLDLLPEWGMTQINLVGAVM